MQLNIRKKRAQSKSRQKTCMTFLSRRHTDDQKAQEKMLNVSNIGEIQVKTTKRFYLISTIFKKSTNDSTGADVEEKEPSYPLGGNVNCYSYCGEQYGSSFIYIYLT